MIHTLSYAKSTCTRHPCWHHSPHLDTQQAIKQHTFGCEITSHILQVPQALDMGLAPVKGTVSQPLKATNTGDAAVTCTWEAGQPFSIVPETASIEANQSFTFTCHFQPSEASVYTVLAACHADTGYTATVKVGSLHTCYLHLHRCSPLAITATTVCKLAVVITTNYQPLRAT